MRILVSSIIVVALLCGCADWSVGDAQPGMRVVAPGETFKLRNGGVVRVAKSGQRLHFSYVVDDSRCPRKVSCVWEGNASVNIQLLVPVDDASPTTFVTSEQVEINTSSRFERRARIGGGIIELVDLSPRPPVANSLDYVATLRFEAAP